MILYRITQFMRGIAAKAPLPAELAEIQKYISGEAFKAFSNMTVPDQRHCINVMHDALRLYEETDSTADRALLVRCALLHDIGRGPDMGVFKKSLAVLGKSIWPEWSRKRAQQDKTSIFYRYYYHPMIGAAMLETMGMGEEAVIILKHHEPDFDGMPPELVLLKQADGQN